MFRYQTLRSDLNENAFRYVISKPFSAKSENSEESNLRLRSIADQSYDLISQIQKLEKLQAIGKLTSKEMTEYHLMIRLAGLMIHLLVDQKYEDKEMMDALLKRYQKYAVSQGIVIA